MFDPCWYIVTSRKAGRRFKAYMKRLGAMPLAVGCWKIPFPNMAAQTAFADSVKNYVADGGIVEMFPLSDWEFACSRYVVGTRGNIMGTVEYERLEGRNGDKYFLTMDFAWSVPRDAPMTKCLLRNEKRELVVFNELVGCFPDAIEWAKGEIAAMSRRDRW